MPASNITRRQTKAPAVLANISDGVLPRARAQEILFASVPGRAKFLDLPKFFAAATKRVFAARNHAIEPMFAPMDCYARFGGWRAEWQTSDYDDSFSFAGMPDGGADAALFWINPENYKMSSQKYAEWFAERCAAFRRASDAPAVVATWGNKTQTALLKKAAESLPGFLCAFVSG